MSGAYYNELDPKAAAWLRELIRHNLIAPGDVDERSIEDITPYEIQRYTQCHFFAGIGVWSYAMRLARWDDSRRAWSGSCPCQPLSQAGKGLGFADERHLWPAWEHLIRECRPPVIFGEQVASKAADSWADLVQDDLEALGYAFGAVPFPAASVGAPHIRDRLYWVAHLEGVGRREERADLGRVVARDSAQGRAAGSEPSGSDSELADTDGRNAGPEREQRGGEHRLVAQDGSTLRLANDDDAGRQQHAQRDGEPTGGLEAGQSWRDAGGPGELRELGNNNAGLEGWGLSAGGRAGERTPWTPSDFVWCRDGKWRPVEPGSFPLVNGAPARMGRVCASCLENSAESANDEDLQALRDFTNEADGRVPSEILQPEVPVGSSNTEAEHAGSGALASAAPLPEQGMREVRRNRRESSAPQRRRCDEQRAGEHRDPVQAVPHGGASCERCGAGGALLVSISGNRVARLRGYGNAIVSEAAKVWIETCVEAGV